MSGQILRLDPCTVPCRGLSCCNCCGEAPGMHFIYPSGTLWQKWDRDCCFRSRINKPEECMHLQGKTREEWMEEEFN